MLRYYFLFFPMALQIYLNLQVTQATLAISHQSSMNHMPDASFDAPIRSWSLARTDAGIMRRSNLPQHEVRMRFDGRAWDHPGDGQVFGPVYLNMGA